MGCVNAKILKRKERTNIDTYTIYREVYRVSHVFKKYYKLRLKFIEEEPSENESSLHFIDQNDI